MAPCFRWEYFSRTMCVCGFMTAVPFIHTHSRVFLKISEQTVFLGEVLSRRRIYIHPWQLNGCHEWLKDFPNLHERIKARLEVCFWRGNDTKTWCKTERWSLPGVPLSDHRQHVRAHGGVMDVARHLAASQVAEDWKRKGVSHGVDVQVRNKSCESFPP